MRGVAAAFFTHPGGGGRVSIERAAAPVLGRIFRPVLTTLVLATGIGLHLTAQGGAPSALLGAALAVSGLAALWGVWPSAAGRDRRARLRRQVVADTVAITLAVAATGGNASPFVLLYFFPVVLAAFELSRQWTAGVAGLAVAWVWSPWCSPPIRSTSGSRATSPSCCC